MPKKTTDKLRRVLNAAARTFSNTCKLVRSRAEAVPATRTSLVGRRRSGSVQSVCPGVQVSTEHGTWIVDTCRHSANLTMRRRPLADRSRLEQRQPERHGCQQWTV